MMLAEKKSRMQYNLKFVKINREREKKVERKSRKIFPLISRQKKYNLFTFLYYSINFQFFHMSVYYFDNR